jgi:hypothetical protein
LKEGPDPALHAGRQSNDMTNASNQFASISDFDDKAT